MLSYVFVDSTRTLDVPTPAELAGSALGVSSISWTWDAFSGIPGISYNVYQATSPATRIYSGALNSFIETGLSTNTANGVAVSAMLDGIESPLSAAATAYTDAAVPGRPDPSSVLYTSFTVTWSVNSNPAARLMRSASRPPPTSQASCRRRWLSLRPRVSRTTPRISSA